jgi:YidC/Oxa1 family membrane protein insertase
LTSMADSPESTNDKKPAGGKKELPMEARLLVAFGLMALVLFLTPYLYKQPKAPQPAKSAPPTTTQTTAKPEPKAPEAAPAPKSQEAAPPVAPAAGQKEETFVVETDLYKVVLSNRGAVIRSWILKKYPDSAGHPLQLVNEAAVKKVGYPFSLIFKDRKPPTDLNNALFVAKPSADSLGIDYEFSDGKVVCRKSLRFAKDRYLTQISSEVTEGGSALPHLLAWRGGFGDAAVDNATVGQNTLYFDPAANKLNTNGVKSAKNGPVSTTGDYSFAGLEDKYFAAVFLPKGNTSIELETFSDTAPTIHKSAEEPQIGAAVGGSGDNRFSVFVGPKDLELLRKLDPRLAQLVDFGWFSFLAKPLFLALNWVHDHVVHNYGWAIIIVTIAINFLLFPLKLTSLKSMKKMQTLQPQIAEINARYKNISLRDPRKAEQNQEVMNLYKKHGVNPMGGCMPMVLQIPFFIAFYKVLSVAIELRLAKWLWVTDLSQPEHLAIRILPVAMIGTQFILQRMTPTTTADPSQQKIMMLMPLFLGFMFYSVSSGLVLYWLTGNLVGIAQQWFINRITPAPVVVAAPVKAQKKGKK